MLPLSTLTVNFASVRWSIFTFYLFRLNPNHTVLQAHTHNKFGSRRFNGGISIQYRNRFDFITLIIFVGLMRNVIQLFGKKKRTDFFFWQHETMESNPSLKLAQTHDTMLRTIAKNVRTDQWKMIDRKEKVLRWAIATTEHIWHINKCNEMLLTVYCLVDICSNWWWKFCRITTEVVGVWITPEFIFSMMIFIARIGIVAMFSVLRKSSSKLLEFRFRTKKPLESFPIEIKCISMF